MKRSQLKNFDARILAALTAEFKDEGFSFTTGNITYSDTGFKTTLEVSELDSTAKQQAEWDAVCALFNLTPADFGFTFTTNGRTFKATGLSPRRPKFPLSGVCASTGKGFKFRQNVIDTHLAK
jgi:hypothetical protein